MFVGIRNDRIVGSIDELVVSRRQAARHRVAFVQEAAREELRELGGRARASAHLGDELAIHRRAQLGVPPGQAFVHAGDEQIRRHDQFGIRAHLQRLQLEQDDAQSGRSSVRATRGLSRARLGRLAHAGLRDTGEGPGSVRLVLGILGRGVSRGSTLQGRWSARLALRTKSSRLFEETRQHGLRWRLDGSSIHVCQSQQGNRHRRLLSLSRNR